MVAGTLFVSARLAEVRAITARWRRRSVVIFPASRTAGFLNGVPHIGGRGAEKPGVSTHPGFSRPVRRASFPNPDESSAAGLSQCSLGSVLPSPDISFARITTPVPQPHPRSFPPDAPPPTLELIDHFSRPRRERWSERGPRNSASHLFFLGTALVETSPRHMVRRFALPRQLLWRFPSSRAHGRSAILRRRQADTNRRLRPGSRYRETPATATAPSSGLVSSFVTIQRPKPM